MKASNPYGKLLAAMREFSLESDRYVERVASLHGLHRTDLNALGFLIRPGLDGNAMTPGKLGDALNLSSPATTALVDRLEKSGHVNRKRSETDRRQIQLAMTEHARAVGRELFTPLAAQMSVSLQNYSPEELAIVQRFLAEMTEATVAAKDSLTAPAQEDVSP
ncbi:MarR family winged helix-turn-helix transcriptional regulator [Arthrobacter sp. GMC3]|uniref:MarR family winged helix-turn-helix transcriptional regulator n=1 Tax=Arthrobacter sp. GMC3 TaxID=2058894 RepID=UPI000CE481CA|nr:MarR family transcriptional regulator [Arthrobacter sp. GMC3]